MKVEKVIEELEALASTLEQKDASIIRATISEIKDCQSPADELKNIIDLYTKIIYYAETALALLNTDEDE